jgi:hypothetical protein
MTIVANLALAAVVALTLCIIPVWQSIPGSLGAGPDRAAVVINPIICAARWFLMSIVMAVCASRGALSTRGATALIGLYFLFEMIAALCMAGQAFGLPGFLSHATVLIPLSLPMPLAAFTFWWLNLAPAGAEPNARSLAIWVSTAIAALGIAAFVAGAMSEDPREKDRAYQLDKEMRWYRTITSLGEIDSLLRFMGPETFPEVRALAVTDLGKRPNLVGELANVFANGSVADAAGAARYLPEMTAAPTRELVDAYVKFTDRTLELLRTALRESEAEWLAADAEAVMIGARALHIRGVDPQLREMSAMLKRFPDRTARVTASIDEFLGRP